MRLILPVVAAGALALFAQADTAAAKGCIKGAIVGGVAGHYMGHHGVAGAAAGCVIGHHEANKKARQQTNGGHVVFVQPFPPTRAIYQVSSNDDGHHPVWSRDGRELFFIPAPGRLTRVRVSRRRTCPGTPSRTRPR